MLGTISSCGLTQMSVVCCLALYVYIRLKIERQSKVRSIYCWFWLSCFCKPRGEFVIFKHIISTCLAWHPSCHTCHVTYGEKDAKLGNIERRYRKTFAQSFNEGTVFTHYTFALYPSKDFSPYVSCNVWREGWDPLKDILLAIRVMSPSDAKSET